MSDLKDSLLNAKYIDIISLADFVVRDCGLPDMDEDGNLMPQANEVAAALFRWAAGAHAAPGTLETLDDAATVDASFDEFDENGDPLMDAETAEKREAEIKAQAEETN
ncbi:hypothetical protein [Pelagimonas varians]|uniref:Uncharacterized protein n=1 Tax=Pelagimonas varians TaxID=696760 RepID=A0A238JSI4_9RHOB|nr:hypothetical protein [Pelagimonas varians]PYG34639.1 hypothetical protein C8N36_101290 [Pelagimonas varians]SMX33134.1 hypothetical protein PEV8663_00176 [Pelagimonas varians]